MLLPVLVAAGCSPPVAPAPPSAVDVAPLDASIALDAGVGRSPALGAGSTEPVAQDHGWSVTLSPRGRAPSKPESWANFEHKWSELAPAAIHAERTMCLPKGRHVFEFLSSPSLDTTITYAGKTIVRQKDFPSEISRPIETDGSCVPVVIELANPLHFPNIVVELRVRESPIVAACDTSAFPKGKWSVCLFHGRNREDLFASETWPKLEVPKGRFPGRSDFYYWDAIEARTTACFAKGTYVFHTTSDDTLALSVDGRTVLDVPSNRRFPKADSPPTRLAGCVPVTVVHSYRYDHSELSLAWATVGSAEEKLWARERACEFECDEQSVCTQGDKLFHPRPGKHVCVPTTRLGREMDYCDPKHPCAPGQGICTPNHGCYQL